MKFDGHFALAIGGVAEKSLENMNWTFVVLCIGKINNYPITYILCWTTAVWFLYFMCESESCGKISQVFFTHTVRFHNKPSARGKYNAHLWLMDLQYCRLWVRNKWIIERFLLVMVLRAQLPQHHLVYESNIVNEVSTKIWLSLRWVTERKLWPEVMWSIF